MVTLYVPFCWLGPATANPGDSIVVTTIAMAATRDHPILFEVIPRIPSSFSWPSSSIESAACRGTADASLGAEPYETITGMKSSLQPVGKSESLAATAIIHTGWATTRVHDVLDGRQVKCGPLAPPISASPQPEVDGGLPPLLIVHATDMSVRGS